MKGQHRSWEEGSASDNLYICGLPEEFDSDSVQQFFAAIGNVTQCKSFGNGYALVRFSSEQEATTVKTSLNGQMPIGCSKPLVITYATSAKKDDWTCPRCGDLQFQKNNQCRLCGCPRPNAGDAIAGAAAPGMPHYAEGGDWTCMSCGDLQFKRNTTCRLCGTPAPGAAGAGGSPADQLLALQVQFAGGKAKGKSSFGKAPQFTKTICKFFLQGTCQKGASCPFSHDESEAAAAGPYGGGTSFGGKGTGKIKGGPMSTIEDFISELITGGLPGGDFDPLLNCVWVSGLPHDTTDENLYQIFATFGAVPPKGARIDVDADGACTGSGFVNFVDSECADMAVMALNGIGTPAGQKLEVKRK